MSVANELEAQGEADFHLRYTNSGAECLVETFIVGEARVSASYSPFEKGASTLHYRFVVERPGEKSEVLVLYSGTAALFARGGYLFHVSEERHGVISWYAMFRDLPTYASVKALVGRIIDGSAKPLMAVRWPKGAKEGEIVAFDGKRLK